MSNPGMSIQDERYTFDTLYYDKYADLDRRYILSYFPGDGSVEMFDVKNKRLFLKRSKTVEIDLRDLAVGKTVVINARQLRIVDYGDNYTREKLGTGIETAFCLVMPSISGGISWVVQAIETAEISIEALQMTFLTVELVTDVLRNITGDPETGRIASRIAKEPVYVMKLTGPNAMTRLRAALLSQDLTSPLSSNGSDLSDGGVPGKGMAAVGGGTIPSGVETSAVVTNLTRRGIYLSPTVADASHDIETVFAAAPVAVAQSPMSSLLIIKPHIIKDRRLGAVLENLEGAGFNVTGACMATLFRDDAEILFELYDSVVPKFSELISEMASGPCLMMEITQPKGAQALRSWAGPLEPLVAQHIAPASIRAQFGSSIPLNAVHVTDLDEDIVRELHMAFNILVR